MLLCFLAALRAFDFVLELAGFDKLELVVIGVADSFSSSNESIGECRITLLIPEKLSTFDLSLIAPSPWLDEGG